MTGPEHGTHPKHLPPNSLAGIQEALKCLEPELPVGGPWWDLFTCRIGEVRTSSVGLVLFTGHRPHPVPSFSGVVGPPGNPGGFPAAPGVEPDGATHEGMSASHRSY